MAWIKKICNAFMPSSIEPEAQAIAAMAMAYGQLW